MNKTDHCKLSPFTRFYMKVACCKDMQQLSFLPMQYRNGRRPLPSVCDKNYIYIHVGNY